MSESEPLRTLPEKVAALTERVRNQGETLRDFKSDIRGDLDELRHDFVQVKKSLEAIEDVLTATKGGWRAIMIMSAIMSALGGAITLVAGKLWPLIGTLPR